MIRNPAGKKEELPRDAPGDRRQGKAIRCPRCKRENVKLSERCDYCGYSFQETVAYETYPSDSPEDLIGRVINDKYRVVSILGEGGFGVVYKVELLLFDACNTFALKILHPSLSQDPKFRQRFLREAALAMQLVHENTIQIREFGRTEEGHLFFTMDYCEGQPLNAVIAREGFLTVNRATYITRQVLSVMKLAHSRGIIHRDLKPENIFLERDGERRDFVKVGDFGLAKSIDAGEVSHAVSTGITQGAILGTPRYMSPEQARGREDLDHRSDLYSIGVVLYEMLYGEVPEDLHDTRPLRAPLHQSHVVPQAVWNVVRRALEPGREDRFQTSDEFLGALEALPNYTPGYVEAVDDSQRSSRTPWWKWPAAALVVALTVALVVSLTADHFGGNAARDVPEQPSYPSARVRDYLPFRSGMELVYAVSIEQGPPQQYSYRIVRESQRGIFEVEVLPVGRKIFWVIEDEKNCFSLEYFDEPSPAGEAWPERHRRELLRLPPGDRLEADFEFQGFHEFTVRRDLVNLEGRYSGCLLAESREGSQRRLQYYKEGLGLVGLEVYEAVTGSPDSEVSERLVYARYLEKPPADAAH
ncbi:MAG: serine/threonine-protein kinase [Planctomycetota bacterium]|nr:serine/threonine-protein kinase [Planctomycetota bacterium]